MSRDRITTGPAPRPNRLRLWTPTAIVQLAAAGLLGGLVGGCTGRALEPGGLVMPLGLGLAGAALTAGAYYHHRRRLVGRGRRVGALVAPPGLSRQVRQLSGHRGKITALAVSGDGKLAVTGGKDRLVILHDVQSGFELRSLAGFEVSVQAAAFSPDGQMFAVAGVEKRASDPRAALSLVRIFATESGQELRQIELNDTAFSLAFMPDGKRLVIGGSNHLQLWEIEEASPVALIDLHDSLLNAEEVRAVAAYPGGRFVLAGGHFSQSLRLVDLDKGEVARRFTGHAVTLRLFRRAAVVSAAFSPDGRRALSGSWDQTARVWDVVKGKQLAVFEGHRGLFGWRGVVGVAFLPDGKRAVSASEDGTLRVWEVESCEELQRFRHGAAVTCLAVTADGRLALTGGSDGVVGVWELLGVRSGEPHET